MHSFSRDCVVEAPVAEVWAWVTTFEGVNRELMPFLRMVPPRHWEHRRSLERLEEVGGAARTRVIDEVAFVPRPAGAAAPAGWVLRRLFAHRHRRLRGHFASGGIGPAVVKLASRRGQGRA